MPKTAAGPASTLEFEKARLDYLRDVYDREMARKDTLEKKSQFYVSFVALFLGGLFLKLDYVAAIAAVWDRADLGLAWKVPFVGSILLVAVALAVVLLAALEAIRARGYKAESPPETARVLFGAEHPFVAEADPARFVGEVAEAYATALDHNRKINRLKSRWTEVSAHALLVAVFGFVVFLVCALGVGSVLPEVKNGQAQEAPKS